ncbi:hypothetical protein SVIO_019210 [Streptomyces violaceusniger]|uniref:Bacterial Ig-like domain-containing protein n=1 Tax=Streptomyces violaceusniger TaxID=68280 RepID=A0A4D4KY72_STRVO|nr:hypothetical protein SVIO_019210 [Streptomyces violaceusniger]
MPGQPVSFVVQVAPAPPGSGAPTGTVTFDFGDGTAATRPLTNGAATVTHAYADVSGSPYPVTAGSPFTITATYNGTDNFATSSGTDTQTVGKAATMTSVVSSPNPSTVSDPVTVTATVSPVAPGAGTPTGTVTLAITERTPRW